MIALIVQNITTIMNYYFLDEIQSRKKTRDRRFREETNRAKHIEEVNERQLTRAFSRSIDINNQASYHNRNENIDINSNQEFPTCETSHALLNNCPFENSFTEAAQSTSASKSVNTASASFAKMLSATPENKWPSLATRSPKTQIEPPPKFTQVTGSKQTSNIRAQSLNKSSDDEYDEDCPRVPDFRQSIGSAIADALLKAKTPKKQDSLSTDYNAPSASSGGKKKKNKKATVLFSTGMNFNGQ